MIKGIANKEKNRENQMAHNSTTATPFEISSYDNPETIRFRKYATGTHLIVHGTEVETGLTPQGASLAKG